MTIPEDLRRDADALTERGFAFEYIEDGERIYMQFSNFPLPTGVYNMETTDLLIFTTTGYPCAGFDMFWTDPELALKDGTVPRQADSIESYLGRNWRRFSYHPNNDIPWNPADDNVGTYVEYVRQRLRNGD